MNFKQFLRSLRAKQKFSSVREQFAELGGEKKLGMTLRNFQLVESGTRPPSEKFLYAILTQISREEYRNAILAYFGSHFENERDTSILAYLEQHLTPAVNSEKTSLYDTPGRTMMMYSNEQLELLTKNSEAMRLHHRLLLWEKIESKDLKGREAAVQELVDLSLAEKSKDGSLVPTRAIFRVPSYESSPPPAVRKATRYFYGIQKSYVSEEGSPDQQLSFALQLVTPSIAQHILDQMVALKKWIQSVASHEPKPGLVPFVFLSFGKRLEDREL